jgi:flagellar protein FlaJ
MGAVSFTRRAYLAASRLYPQRLVAGGEKLAEQGGIPHQEARLILGFAAFSAVGAGFAAFFLGPFLIPRVIPEFYALLGLAASGVVLGLLYAYLAGKAEARADQIETLLPDALQIISSNIRAGMTLENAFWSAGRPEFGSLRDEIKKVSGQTLGGRPFRDALSEMRERVRSEMLARAIRLITEGVSMGGEMARLLEEVSKDIRNTQLLRREIQVQTAMYAIFIIFAAVVVSPILFGVALFYTEVSERLEARTVAAQSQFGQSSAASPASTQAFGVRRTAARSPDRITAADVRNFSTGAIGLTNFFAALLIGSIRTGQRIRGLRYVLVFVLVAMALFTLTHGLLSTALGSVGR